MTAAPDSTQVILVDAEDSPVGSCEKLHAHRHGLRHRAVSVFAFDGDGRVLVQQRAAGKYHSAGLWSNSACTHPRIGESNTDAARRCLREELGLDAQDLRHAFSMEYRAAVGGGLVEHEYDHVYTATVNGEPEPDPAEVAATARVPLDVLIEEAKQTPDRYTAWFKLLLPRMRDWRASTVV